jgi:hypothetical protein
MKRELEAQAKAFIDSQPMEAVRLYREDMGSLSK